MQLKYLDLDGLTSFYNQFTDKVTELVTTEVEEAGGALQTSLQGWVNDKLGAASGIATLDANKKLTASQLPDITFPDYTNIYVALGATNQTVQGNKTFSGTTTFGSSLTISNTGITKIGSGTVNIGSSSAPINNIYATTFTGSLSGNATTATTATKLGTDDVGNNMTPMYLTDGVPTAMPYTIQKSVPANAIFTDTVYTLTAANDTALGGIKTGFTTTGKRYAIKVDSSGNAYVDVNWTDTNTTYTLESFGITVTAAEINYLSGLTSNVKTQLDTINKSLNGKINSTEKGAANGVATLDSNGHVLASQLPSSVDEIVEITDLSGTGEAGKIYVNTTNNKTYRWSGSSFVEISASLALGETASTAYYGDKGKTAYDHSQITSGNPHGTTADQVGAPNKDGTNATGTWGIAITGNAATATKATTADSAAKLTTARTISLTGDVTGTTTFDGSGNVQLNTTIANASSGDVVVRKYYWHTEFTASTSSVTISTWSYYKDLNPDVEVYFNGFLLFPIGSDGAGEYSFDSSSGTITFPNALGGNTTQQQIVVVIRTYNKDEVVIPKVATPVITIVS